SPILQFLEQPDVSQRIIKPVVVQIHQRAARIQLVPVHTDTQTVELIESYLAIENLPKAGPDFVAVNPESTEQTVSQEDGCHRDERCWNADGEDIIGLAPHVFTDGKIHDEGAQYAGGYSDRQEYFGLRKDSRILGVPTHLAQAALYRSTCCPRCKRRPKLCWCHRSDFRVS